MLTVELPKEVERKLTERAARTGRPVESVALELIERGIAGDRSLDEILMPFREQVAASGLSDADLEAMFEEARDEVHAEKSGPPR
jgi:plasmid stability protein